MPTVEEMRAALKSQDLSGIPPSQPSIDEMRAALKSDSTPVTKPPKDEIIQEQHPNFSYLSDRFPVEALGGDKTVEFLQSNHPELQIKKGPDNQVIAKLPTETQWKVLAPNFSSSFGDIGSAAKKIGDMAIPLGSGALSSAAATGAGLAAAPATLGAASVPAAMAAGGATSAGLDYLRQKIAQQVGTQSPDLDKASLAISGLLGGVAPAFTGIGATKGEIAALLEKNPGLAESMLAKAGQLTKLADPEKAAADELMNATRGITKYAPKIASTLSGVPEDSIRNAPNKLTQGLKDLLLNGKEDYTPEAINAIKGAKTNMDLANPLGQAAVANSLGSGDLNNQVQTAVRKNLVGLQGRIGQALDKSGAILSVDKPIEILDKHIAKAKISGTDADLALAEKLEKLKNGYFSAAYGENIPPTKYMAIKNSVADAADFTGRNPVTPTSDKEMQAMRDVWHAMNDDLAPIVNTADQKLGQNGKLTQLYRAQKDTESKILPAFKTNQAGESALLKMDKPNRQVFTKALDDFDKANGTNIRDLSDLAGVQKPFANPSWTPQSGNLITSTSRTLGAGLLGGYLGEQAGGHSGAAGGFALGSGLTSPAAIKYLIKGAKLPGVRQFLDGLASPYAAKVINAAPVSAWQSLRSDK